MNFVYFFYLAVFISSERWRPNSILTMGISRRHHLQWMGQQVQWSERQRSDEMKTAR
jgi:hypothetical protein